MDITTKFNLGETVFYLNNQGTIQELLICSVVIHEGVNMAAISSKPKEEELKEISRISYYSIERKMAEEENTFKTKAEVVQHWIALQGL